MKKKKVDVAELFAENIFKDIKFQENWQGYLEMFGRDVDVLFAGSYKAKVHFAATLRNMRDGNYKEACRDLKSYLNACSNDEEAQIFNRLIGECEKHIPPETYPEKSARYMRYRNRLLSSGFSEAKKQYGHFFLHATEKTAFVINLYDEENAVSVLYGFASTAYMAGEEEYFSDNGSHKDYCQVRNILCICDDSEEAGAVDIISEFYNKYKCYSKDEILALKKERQKDFLAHFTPVLKPLGFKKKGTRWTKDLGNGDALSFEAQKSAYSDEYYFNVNVHDISNFYAEKYGTRVVINNSQIYNWQLMTENQIEELIQYTLKTYIIPKIEEYLIV